MTLTHGNRCPKCGKSWEVSGEMQPNTYDRDFYGGRVKFFQEVKCNCDTEYVLCIARVPDPRKGEKYVVIDMVDISKENPFKSLEKKIAKKKEEQKKESELNEHVLTTLVTKEMQIKRLEICTQNELQTLCKLHKVKMGRGDSKYKLIERLLEAVPNLVVANPND